MHQQLINYINSNSTFQLTGKEEELVMAAFKPKKFKKKQYFLKEGDVCRHSAFIVKGAMRQYSVDEKGVEHVVHFYIENYWASDRESLIMLTPSVFNIEACEDTEMLMITRADMQGLISNIPAIGEMLRLMDERNAIANQRRLNSTVSSNAVRRYEEFARDHPQFIQRFPQYLIASFLGITQESLSRIRKNSGK